MDTYSQPGAGCGVLLTPILYLWYYAAKQNWLNVGFDRRKKPDLAARPSPK
jgi:hypothetical protein